MPAEIATEELLFFAAHKSALPLYLCLRAQLLTHCGQVRIQVKKSQISFANRHLFCAVSFTPVRRAAQRPDPFLTVTFGLPHRLLSPRIDAAVEAYPGRWTHHVMLGSTEDVDGQLLAWLKAAAEFSNAK